MLFRSRDGMMSYIKNRPEEWGQLNDDFVKLFIMNVGKQVRFDKKLNIDVKHEIIDASQCNRIRREINSGEGKGKYTVRGLFIFFSKPTFNNDMDEALICMELRGSGTYGSVMHLKRVNNVWSINRTLPLWM